MRAPVHCRCRSVLLPAVVALLLMSSADARAAGHRDDEGFFQAVIQGRKDAREAYDRKLEEEKRAAAEASRMRESEASVRGTESGPFSGRRGAPGGGSPGAEAPEGRDGGEEETGSGGGVSWTIVMLAGVVLAGLLVLRRLR